ncbi:flavin reductase family protein [Sulfolobus acidocaldarius]|uniref:Conserved Crenarchaeal protein n=4 Tax=Sulfolobus acidocaldarius TaxID=2285 RepID=Q4J6Q5_SULAC|nr:flavin reductase family protein [Sulfolobus acidocaldarius]AAY81526.1 conserved Crenarchaeal protein [Sulfolobus acidocaldarius DSM 639]AGE72129.1 hypothetical protein SacN8_10915 [Sulfolobus acidocaldarius N8]AGE74446.1 hypothetical protein SacRon12I_11160 [Sulfolobus acidocaldarius Ron12/I]ALU29697.1 flavin reductase [Sulfolobus acidocaldarius]ALU32432.1 flavin reductase [Sulfolobus acidocaldarius]
MSELLRNVMRNFPLGVAIVTTNWNGRYIGMTINTFNSLSLNPPLIMFSADRIKGNDKPFRESNGFVINFVDNEKLLDIFAFKDVKERFDGIEVQEGKTGSPIFPQSYAYLEARKYQIHDVGDHSIIIGEVIDGKIFKEDFSPLVYFRRAYWKLSK